MIKGKSFIEPKDLDLKEMDDLFVLAKAMENNPEKWSSVARNKILATLFFEPSTRTRLSFEAAMLRIGGDVIGFADPSSSSTAKGESLADTIRTVSSYTDLIVMRNPKEGSALLASQYSTIPVINAGDGTHHHPTQTLTDLLTIKNLKGRTEKLTIGFCGDLKFGRTVHSLSTGLARYPDNEFFFVSLPELSVPDYIKKELSGSKVVQTDNLENVLPQLDVLYMTRIQKERFFNEEDYFRLKDNYILTAEKMKLAKKDMIVLHPLPRVNEIDVDVDKDERAAYFRQVKYGMYVRMALMASILGV